MGLNRKIKRERKRKAVKLGRSILRDYPETRNDPDEFARIYTLRVRGKGKPN